MPTSRWVQLVSAFLCTGFLAALVCSQEQSSNLELLEESARNGNIAPPVPILNDHSCTTVSGNREREVLEFTADELNQNGGITPQPKLTLDVETAFEGFPFGGAMAFDSTGDLWVALLNGSISMYPASELTGAGEFSGIPSVTLTTTVWQNKYDTIVSPGGLAFDATGDLRVSGREGAGTIAEFTPDELVSSGLRYRTHSSTQTSDRLTSIFQDS